MSKNKRLWSPPYGSTIRKSNIIITIIVTVVITDVFRTAGGATVGRRKSGDEREDSKRDT